MTTALTVHSDLALADTEAPVALEDGKTINRKWMRIRQLSFFLFKLKMPELIVKKAVN